MPRRHTHSHDYRRLRSEINTVQGDHAYILFKLKICYTLWHKRVVEGCIDKFGHTLLQNQ